MTTMDTAWVSNNVSLPALTSFRRLVACTVSTPDNQLRCRRFNDSQKLSSVY